MVVKASVWIQKFASKAAAMGHYTPDMFVKSQWQKTGGVSVYYVVYRSIFACIFLSIIIVSLVSVDSTGYVGSIESYYAKWPIYLTHWGITMCTVQALVGAVLVIRERCLGTEKETETMKMRHSFRVYWILQNIALVGAFAISAIYWIFVYDPDEMALNALNLSVHAANSVLMFLDLVVVAFPIRLIDFYWPLIYSLLYSVFNLIYYLAGGTDRKGRTYIYTILDWTKPGQSVLVLLLSFVFVVILQVCVSLLSVLRRRVKERWRRQQTNIADSRAQGLQGISNEIPISDLA